VQDSDREDTFFRRLGRALLKHNSASKVRAVAQPAFISANNPSQISLPVKVLGLIICLRANLFADADAWATHAVGRHAVLGSNGAVRTRQASDARF
jgi:hypothetical protein